MEKNIFAEWKNMRIFAADFNRVLTKHFANEA